MYPTQFGTCENCGKSFKAYRVTKKFCSDKCRLQYHRKKPTDSIETLANQAYLAIRALAYLVDSEDHEQARQAVERLESIHNRIELILDISS